MKKVWIIPAIIAVLICVLFVLLNRDNQPSSEVTPKTEKTTLSDTQIQENNVFGVSGKVIDGSNKKPLAAKIIINNGDKIIATTKTPLLLIGFIIISHRINHYFATDSPLLHDIHW